MTRKALINVAVNGDVNTPIVVDLDGVVDGNPAPAGQVGEQLATTVTSASAVAVSTGTAKDVASLALTPGEWLVQGLVHHKPAGTTNVTQLRSSISATVDTEGTQAGAGGIGAEGLVVLNQAAAVPAGDVSQVIPPVRVIITANTTLHLVAKDTFTVSTMGVYGSITARRVR